jgi:hypothetical protein
LRLAALIVVAVSLLICAVLGLVLKFVKVKEESSPSREPA